MKCLCRLAYIGLLYIILNVRVSVVLYSAPSFVIFLKFFNVYFSTLSGLEVFSLS